MAAPKTLSQSEIDALLSGMGPAGSGEPAPASSRPVKDYDFRRPDKFSKDHLRAAQMVFDFFARLMSSSLSAYLRGSVSAHLSTVDQVSYDDYIQQLPTPAVIGLISMNPLPDQAIIELNLPLTYAMIDRLLGGRGRSDTVQQREPTEIEQTLIRSTMRQLLACYRDSWTNVASIEPQLQDLVFNTAFLQAAVPGAVAILGVVEIDVMGVKGTISVAIPYTVLEPVMPRLTSQMWLSGSRPSDPATTQFTDDHLQAVNVNVSARLGGSDLRFEDLLQLQVGDVIRLDTSIGGDVEVAVGDFSKYLGTPGRVGNTLSVQLTRVVEE